MTDTVKEKLKEKLISRKFWAAVAAVLIALAPLVSIDETTANEIVAVVSACASLIAYIFGEGMVDVARIKADAAATGGNENE